MFHHVKGSVGESKVNVKNQKKTHKNAINISVWTLVWGHQRHVTRLDNYGSTGSLLPVWCISSSIEMDQTLPTRLTCWACRTNTHFVKDIDSSATPQHCKTTLFLPGFSNTRMYCFERFASYRGCTASCFFKKHFKNFKDLNLTPQTRITKWLQLVHPPCCFFWWPDSLQLPSNPVSVCLPGVFWWKNPGGVTGSPWRSRISGSFCIGKQQTVESFNKFGIVLERKETHEPRETLGAEEFFWAAESCFCCAYFFMT